MHYLATPQHFSFNILKSLPFDFILSLNFETVSNHREVNNSNRGDVAPLAWDYCSLIIRALHLLTRSDA